MNGAVPSLQICRSPCPALFLSLRTEMDRLHMEQHRGKYQDKISRQYLAHGGSISLWLKSMNPCMPENLCHSGLFSPAYGVRLAIAAVQPSSPTFTSDGCHSSYPRPLSSCLYAFPLPGKTRPEDARWANRRFLCSLNLHDPISRGCLSSARLCGSHEGKPLINEENAEGRERPGNPKGA